MDDRSTRANDGETQPAAGLRELAYVLVRDDAEADDLAQDAWFVLDRRADLRGDARARFGFGVLRNLVRNRRRRERLRVRVERTGARSESVPSAGDDLQREETSTRLREHVHALPEPYRGVIELRYLDELPADEVARRLARPAATVRSQSARGLALLRERLDREHPGGRTAWAAWLAPLGPDAIPAPASWAVRGWLLAGAAAIVVTILALRGAGSRTPDGTTQVASIEPTAAQSVASDARASTPVESGRRAVDSALLDEPARSASALPAASESGAGTGVERAVVVTVDAAGEPVAGANVYVLRSGEARLAGTSNATGRVEFEFTSDDLSADVRVFAPTKLGLIAEDRGRATSLLVLVDRWRAIAGAVRIPLDRGGVLVEGRVLDPAGAPLAGAVVEYGEIVARVVELEPGVTRREADARRTTDAAGRFRLRAGPGPLWMRATAAGRGTAIFGELVGSQPEHACELRFARGHGLSGRVRLASGEPAAGARVFVDPGGAGLAHEVFADADGRYALLDVRVGRRLVWAVHGAESTSFVLDARTGGSSAWDADLDRRRALRVRLVDEFGLPRAGYGVCLKSVDGGLGWQRALMTDAEGRIGVVDVPDAPIDVLVAPIQRYVPYPTLERRLDRVGDEELVLALSSAHVGSGALRGTVVDAAGRALDMRAGLIARKHGSSFVSDVPVDARDGAFRVEGLPHGEYEIGIALRSPHDRLEGFVGLGTRTIRAGGETELGTCVVPASGRLAVENAVEVPGIAYEIDVRTNGRADANAVQIRFGATRLDETLELAPGDYEVRARDAWRVVAAGRARVESGRTSTLVLEPVPPAAK